MDREKLKALLAPFQEKCAELGRPIENMCVEEAFPGDASTSFIVQVRAPWVDHINCYDAIDFLFDRLFETTSEETRRKVFSIQVMDSNDALHCESEPVAVKTT